MKSVSDKSKPFLWGPVKSALVQEAKSDGLANILRLCFTEEQRVKEMMVGVLTDLGRDDPTLVNGLLEDLLPLEKSVGKVRQAWRLIRKPVVSSDKATLNARKIAIEVAANLGSRELFWVLKGAAVHSDPAVRTAAVRNAYHLWKRDPDLGFELLDYLAENVMDGLVPNLGAFESAMGLSLIIFFDHTRNVPVLKRLQVVWREILTKGLRIKEDGTRIGNAGREFLRDRVFSIAFTVIFRTLDEMPKGYTVINYPDLAAFFQLGASDKELYSKLVPYLDPAWSGSKEEMEANLLAGSRIKDLLTGMVVFNSVVAHAMADPLAILPFLERLIQACKDDPLPNHILAYVPRVLGHMMDRGHLQDEVFDLLVVALDAHQDYYVNNPDIPGLTYKFNAPHAEYVSGYLINHYVKNGTVMSDWIVNRIEAALARDDLSFFQSLFTQELPFVGIEMRKPQIALETLSLFFTNHKSKIEGKIDELIQVFLSRLRLHYPDEVDDFLESQAAPEDVRLQVLTKEPAENIGELIGGQRAYLFVRDDVIFGSPELLALFVNLLAKATDYKTVRQWLDYGLREVINVVYGAEVLRQTK